MTLGSDDWIHLQRAGTSLLVVLVDGVPVVHHWGAALGDLEDAAVGDLVSALSRTVTHSSVDVPRSQPLVPDPAAGFTGTPGVTGHRTGGGPAPSFRSWTWEREGSAVALRGTDEEAALAVTCRLALDDHGVLTLAQEVANLGDSDWTVGEVVGSLPLPPPAREVLDLTGRWTRERAPQRLPLQQGTWRRAGRHGRTGHDAPLLTVVGTPGFSWRAGQVWGVHVAWSGDHVSFAERTPEGFAALGGGELLAPGEVVLGPGETYQTPVVVGVWSDEGLDGLSARLHGHVRAFPHLADRRRPVVLNTWEAVYFDHDVDTLRALAEVAAQVGVERFVLDDGWFVGRTDDRRALGDWRVCPDRWPDGLHPLVDHVRGLGMEFGLWVEPEMVNEDSEVARAHPDWILRGRDSLPQTWRHQQVIDLQHPDAYAYLVGSLGALLEEYPISFLKWDHNRDLLDVAHGGRAAVHGQTRALYRLLDELGREHPQVEIETCASGGGRVDLGILARTHRLWASDTNDALERLGIQRWTQLLVPPELVGQHVGPPTAHTTGRTHRLGFRAAAALLGHFGMEWDLLSAPDEQLTELQAWIEVYKRLRPTLLTGRLVRGDHPDPGLLVTGVVSADGGQAWYVLAQRAASETSSPLPVVLPGLDGARSYRVRSVGPADVGAPRAELSPSWLDTDDGVVLPGAVLTTAGVRPPVMVPESARVLHVEAEDRS